MGLDRAQLAKDLDDACRTALTRYRVEAFDNIDVDSILGALPVSLERAEWVGRHLLRHGRRLDAYRAGQHILRLLRGIDVA